MNILHHPQRFILALPLVFGVSCGYNYQSEQLTVYKGQHFQTHHNGKYSVVKVSPNSITTRRGRESTGFTFDKAGRSHMNNSHSLGNNESLRLLETAPEKGEAKIELMWLESTGFLTMPPF